MGGGRFLAGFRSLLDPSVELRGYDIEGGQLALFRELYPEVAATIPCALLDITTEAVPVPMDVVVASTVLMHIQRPDAYLRAIRNLVASARRAIVVMDNYATHDYVSDLTAEVGRESLYVYETGRAVAIVVSRAGKLGPPYVPLGSAAQLH